VGRQNLELAPGPNPDCRRCSADPAGSQQPDLLADRPDPGELWGSALAGAIVGAHAVARRADQPDRVQWDGASAADCLGGAVEHGFGPNRTRNHPQRSILGTLILCPDRPLVDHWRDPDLDV